MAHCPFECLGDLEDLLQKVRKLEHIREPKPGIFYYKSKPFLHFHIKGEERWADVRGRGEWEKLDASLPISAKQRTRLMRKIECLHDSLLNKKS